MSFESFLYWHYNLTPEDVEVADTPGVWRLKQPCKGRPECKAPLHTYLWCDGPTHHTVHYRDSSRDPKTGRWASPHRTWRAHRGVA